MIDLRQLRADPDLVRASQRARGSDPGLVDALLAADEQRRVAVTRADQLRQEQKTTSNEIRAAEPPERTALMERARTLAATVKEAEAEQAAAEAA
ncbi:MAG: serine--tRNA ligase, partial [Actinomycetota bacterium]|nr:serine--tRNA ligase [Actinomycetota bacterium]